MTFISCTKTGRKRIFVLRCDHCEKEYTPPISATRFFTQKIHFCGLTCSRLSLIDGKLKEQQNATNLEKYGTTKPLELASVREKAKQTTLQNYGVEYSMQNKDLKKQMEKIVIEKYGGTELGSPIIKERAQATNIIRYGFPCTLQNKEIFEKVYAANIKRNIEKYGVVSTFSLPEVREKIKQTNLERYGKEIFLWSQDYISKCDFKAMSVKAWQTMIKNKTFSTSKPEEKMYILLVSKFGVENVIRQFKLIGQRIDFYVISIDTYVQVDGLYWHGLDRDIEIIKLERTGQDTRIYGQVLRDQKLNQYMFENNKRLVRITDIQMNNLSDEEILKLLEI